MNSKFTFSFFLLSLLAIAGHFFAVNANILKGDIKTASIIDLFILFVTGISALILYAKTYDAEKFTARFLIATTVQFISFLSMVAALVFKKIPELKYWSLSAVALFVTILIIQTTLLLIFLRSNVNNKKS